MNQETVILLHGIARTKQSMNTLARALEKQGARVINIGYPSTKMNIANITHLVHQEIQTQLQANERVHFVGYSMGCLILRQLLAQFAVQNMGNIVLIAPPNHGSQVADFLENNFLYRYFYGPAGLELTTSFAKNSPFPSLVHPFGVIAGNLCIDPLCYFLLPKGHDGKVTIESTKLDGMKDHITLKTSHTFIIHNPVVIAQVIHFLKHQQFDHTFSKAK
jgi:hypothetical protein